MAVTRYTLDAITLDDDGEQIWTRLFDGDRIGAYGTLKATAFEAGEYIISRWDAKTRRSPEVETERSKFDDERQILSVEYFLA